MIGRIVLLTLALTTFGCEDILQKIAKKNDAGDGTPASSPTATSAGSDDAPPADTSTAAAAGTSTVATGAGVGAGARGTATGPKTANAPSNANAAASPAELEKAFASLDINKDNQLDGIEVRNCGCAIADANGDGEVTKAEYLAGGLVGKFRPGASGGGAAPSPSPSPSSSPSPTQAQTTQPPPAPAAGGVPPGLYVCSGMVGTMYMTTGRLLIIDAKNYATGADRSGPGTYDFFPDTGMIVFRTGPNSKMDQVSFARLIAPNRIQMKTGENGRNHWDCKR